VHVIRFHEHLVIVPANHAWPEVVAFYCTVSMPHLRFMAPLQALSLPDEMPVIDIYSL
jgi:hypothetical protein